MKIKILFLTFIFVLLSLNLLIFFHQPQSDVSEKELISMVNNYTIGGRTISTRINQTLEGYNESFELEWKVEKLKSYLYKITLIAKSQKRIIEFIWLLNISSGRISAFNDYARAVMGGCI